MTFDIEREARAFLDKRYWAGRPCTPGDLIDFGRMAFEAGATDREKLREALKEYAKKYYMKHHNYDGCLAAIVLAETEI